MFRGNARSWLQDPLALELARAAVANGDDMRIDQSRRSFMYMPFMHSESAQAHEEAIVLFESLGKQDTLKYELLHKQVIDTYGRYPYRNEILGRVSTPAELEYLKTNKGFWFFTEAKVICLICITWQPRYYDEVKAIYALKLAVCRDIEHIGCR